MKTTASKTSNSAVRKPTIKKTKKVAKKNKPATARAKAAVSKTGVSRNGLVRLISAENISPEQHRQIVAVAAYLRAEKRGFVNGDPVDDWLTAELEINKMISRD